jgi:Holliday junction resolvase
MTPEAKVKKRVRAELEKRDGIYYFMPATGGYGRSGVPDIVGCYLGTFFAIECKAGAGKTTALQDREITKIIQAYGKAIVVNEDNLPSVNEMLDEIQTKFLHPT